jgi:hypothetical protein
MGLLLVPQAVSAHGVRAASCSAVDLNQGTDPNPACNGVPSFKASFLNRVWSFNGAVDNVDLEAHNLDMTLSGIENLPARFSNQDDAILDQDTHVLFNSKTRVYGPDGQRVTQDYLDYAEGIVVRGKLVAPSKWASDEEGTPVPTVRAKRLYITEYVQDASDAHDNGDQSSNDQSSNDQSSSDQSSDPTPGDGVISSYDVDIWIHIHFHMEQRGS